MKTLTLFFLLITFLISHSKPNHQGFTVDLIHRDSHLSPSYNPNNVLSNRLQNAYFRSIFRASYLSKRASLVSKMEADISGVLGEYLMQIKIGTPPIKVFGVADTGSDLTWAQCEPCRYCYKQTGPPFIVPSSSSTYQTLSCQAKACEALDGNQMSCDSKNNCHYKMSYGDRSYTIGDLAMDTFWFGSTSLKNVIFGCGHDNNGTFNEDASGIIGLGGGPLSIVNQLNPVIQGQFSYCLIPYLNDSSNQTSKIHFGGDANVLGVNVVSTPIVKKDPSTYYYVTLENVLVRSNDGSYNHSFLQNRIHEGNIIIDSGTTVTFIPRELYSNFISVLIKGVGGETVVDPQGTFDLCYKDLDLDRVPLVTFRFTEADVVVPPVNMFLEVQKGVSCLTIVPSDDLAIFGNLLQRNFLVGFDLVNQTISFMPTDCTQYM